MKKIFPLLLTAMFLFLSQAAGVAAEEIFESSKVCRECHGDIYRNWEKSLHALSFTNPIFLSAYRKAYTNTAGEAKKYCLDCHAPTVALTGDYDARLPITSEGVTCDFCHTITEIHLDRDNKRFVNVPGEVKRSVLKNVDSPYHKTEYSSDFASSKLCAGCHDFKNRHGVQVSVTYSEWQNSSFAREGKQCQACHMPEIPGKTVNEGGRNRIHDHSLSHNIETMQNAIKLETEKIIKDENGLVAKIRITNMRVGHAIPTGTPGRRLVLEVHTLDGSGMVIETRKKVFAKIIIDDTGRELLEDGDAFLFGRELIADNRLGPDETRIVTFFFSKRKKDIKKVEAEAYFFYEPKVLTNVKMKIPLYKKEWDAGGE